ncbi:MAG: glycosyltransferase family 2 protein [Chloroflexi bacterium]|nr:glycosyltransferase family 2 protein [Chloroflexota bacterium]
MPYRSTGGRRNNVQIGVGRSIWAGTPPSPIPERVLDGIPGCAAWLALLLSIAAAVAFPRALLFVAALLGLYSAVRFLFAGIANVRGLRLIHQWEQIDWRTRYCDEKDAVSGVLAWDDVQHVVIIPNYKEPAAVLERTLEVLAAQYEARQRLTIVLAMEAAEERCAEKAEALRQKYLQRFAAFYYTVHPRGLPGEMQCKSANQAWAARWIKRRLVDEMGYNLDHIVVTTMDADTRWHRHYFYALTYLFAINPQRYLRFWQGPIRYHGNIWEINPLMRLVNAYATAFELAYLAAPWWMPLPMSSYSLSLRLLDSSGYWDTDVIADEWHMFIKAYFARGGDVQLIPVFLPFLADATTGVDLWDAIKNRYQQTLRHAWGSKEVGFTIARMLEHPEMRFLPAFNLLARIAHDILLAGAGWIILTAGSQLPLWIHPALLQQILSEGFNNPTFTLLQVSFFTVSILGIVFWYQDVMVRPPRTQAITFWERVLTLLSFPLLPLLTLLFVALPVLQAQTRLLVGVPLQFRVTKKL